MIYSRPSQARGQTKIDWLDSRHSFSFGDYQDPRFMGFRSLRVINEDWIKSGAGFPTHSHRDMEIITYVIQGELAHKDSLGNGSVIKPGEVQIMSAGTGIHHSEYNSAQGKDTHLLQIWLLPETRNLKPRYAQQSFNLTPNELHPVCSRDERQGSLLLYQDAALYAANIDKSGISYALPAQRFGWVQLISGTMTVNGHALEPGDGLALIEEPVITFQSDKAEFLFFDLG